MLRIILISLLTITSANASHLETVCTEAFQGDSSHSSSNPPMFSEGLISRRSNGEYILEKMDGVKIFSDSTEIKDFIVLNDKVWVLNPFDLTELNLKGEVLGRYTYEASNSPSWEGLTFSLAGNTLVIAQGAGGLKAFDITTHKIIWHTMLPDVQGGMPVTVATNGNFAYAAMATTYQDGFTGIVTVNLATGDYINKVAYSKEWGVIDTTPRASWFNDSLVLNNGGWIHVLTKKQLESKKAVKPRWVAHIIPANGPVNQHYMILSGGFFFEGNNLVGCGVLTDVNADGQFIRRSSLFKTAMP